MSERGTGRTTRQIKEAAEDAVFVYAGHRDYTLGLCRHLGRIDLVLRPLDFENVFNATVGTHRQIVIDHAIPINVREYREWGMILELRVMQALKLTAATEKPHD